MAEQKKKMKINIIDLAIIIVILAAAVIVGVKYTKSNSIAVGGGNKYIVTYYAEEVSEFVANKINIGDPVSDEQKNSALGTVTDIQLAPSVSYSVTSDGEIVKSTKPDYNSMLLTTEVDGTDYEHGVIISSNKYGIGHSMTIRAGKSKVYLRIYDIQKAD